jgi:hypothetical protein
MAYFADTGELEMYQGAPTNALSKGGGGVSVSSHRTSVNRGNSNSTDHRPRLSQTSENS